MRGGRSRGGERGGGGGGGGGEQEEENSHVEYGPTTGCDASLSRIELGYGSKFTESRGQFLLAFRPGFLLLCLVSVGIATSACHATRCKIRNARIAHAL